MTKNKSTTKMAKIKKFVFQRLSKNIPQNVPPWELSTQAHSISIPLEYNFQHPPYINWKMQNVNEINQGQHSYLIKNYTRLSKSFKSLIKDTLLDSILNQGLSGLDCLRVNVNINYIDVIQTVYAILSLYYLMLLTKEVFDALKMRKIKRRSLNIFQQ